MSEKWSDIIDGEEETDRSWILEEPCSYQQSQQSVGKEGIRIDQVREQVIGLLRYVRRESAKCDDVISVFYYSLTRIIPMVLTEREMNECLKSESTEDLANKICSLLFLA